MEREKEALVTVLTSTRSASPPKLSGSSRDPFINYHSPPSRLTARQNQHLRIPNRTRRPHITSIPTITSIRSNLQLHCWRPPHRWHQPRIRSAASKSPVTIILTASSLTAAVRDADALCRSRPPCAHPTSRYGEPEPAACVSRIAWLAVLALA